MSSFSPEQSQEPGDQQLNQSDAAQVPLGAEETDTTVVDLCPFDAPSDFDHGEEFEPPRPRPIPKYLRTGSHAKRQKGLIYSLIALGIMFIIFWPIPFVQGLSFYILPLKGLHWIGFGLIGIGVLQFVLGIVKSGRYAYVKQGEPIIGRVVDCQPVVTGTQDAPAFQYVARVAYRHPVTDEFVVADIPELDHWAPGKEKQMSCTLKQGDYVTLVYHPGKEDKTLAVYGFLGLDPEREFILKNGQPLEGTSPFTALMITFLISFIVLLVMAGFDVLMFSCPTGGDWKLPVGLAVGGFLLSGLLGAGLWKPTPDSSSPIASFIGIGILGAFAAPLLLFILNTRLDFAPAIFKPFQIVEFWETTHNFVIRDYELEYRDLESNETHKQHVRVSQLTPLYGAEYGVASIGSGRFGYTWIKGFHPIVWLPESESEAIEGPLFEVTLNIPLADEDGAAEQTMEQTAVMKPVIALDNGEFAPVPEILIDREVQHIQGKIEVKMITPVKR